MQAKCTFLLLKKMFIFAVLAELFLALAPAAQAEPVDYVDFVGDASTLLNLSGRDVREVLAAVNFWDPDRVRAKDVGVIQGVDFDDFRNNVDDTGSPIPLLAGVPGATLATIIAQEPGREFGAGELGSVDGTQIGTFTPQNADNIEAEKLAQGGAYFQDKIGTTMTFSFGADWANKVVEVQMLGGGMWDKEPEDPYMGILTASVGGVDLGYVEDQGYNMQLSTFETTTDGNGDLLIDLTLTGDRYVVLAGIIVTEPAPAHWPDPTHGATDVYRDTLLSWTPDEFAATHDLYIGDSFEDVNDATVPTHAGLDVNSFDLGRLEFGQTYYWRVDEVNGAPDNTVFKGGVWVFEVEPYSIQIPGDGIVAFASSVQGTSGPENTINGSGLDPKTGTHNTTNADMWFSLAPDMSPWLQYEFDDVKLLDKLLLWNSNSVAELAIGWGLKDVQIEYSVDGTEWTPLPDVAPLNRATGLPTYDTPDEVPLGNVPAKFVKISMLSNQGGVLPAYSVSEVQFFEIPVKPRTPNPEDQAVDVMPDDATLTWRAGREAAEHIITISADANAMIDGSATSVTTSTNSLSLSDIGGELGQTYYWRVDEVNDAEVPSVWAGPMWTFSTQAALIVEDFEAYGNESPNRPFQTWLDGFGYSADEFFPVAYPGNGTGSAIGHDVWTLSSPYYDGKIMESLITMEGSNQSMPFYYDNSGGGASAETTANIADLQVSQDWSQSGIQTLTLHFRAESLPEALDTTYDLTTEGDALWYSQDVNSYEDGDAARSGSLSNNVQSSMQTTVSGPGTVSFYWKVSSELDWDFLDFYIDGAMQDQISGEVDWEQKTYQITGAGSHTLEWRYTKDAAVFGGIDAGWVDKLEWDGAGQPATAPGNTGQLYAKINGTKVTYPGSVGDVKWTAWQIDLTSLGVNLQNVTTLTIGVEGNDASGVLYFDNFWLQ